jgi:hypothetical protein
LAVNFCHDGLEQASAALLIFGLLFIATWIEAVTKIEAAADWIRWWLYLDGSPIVGWGCTVLGCTWRSANAYMFFPGMER